MELSVSCASIFTVFKMVSELYSGVTNLTKRYLKKVNYLKKHLVVADFKTSGNQKPPESHMVIRRPTVSSRSWPIWRW